ncbi:MAG: pyridoxamine 5'-phosphate oxidase family protein, partial [Candidatus Methanomethylophilaceae archaeon]|nr:pyridoxamine 5'-phosphate oxidase family protein [Candidatus Methanomethylophilaceae archaeon]
MNAIKGTMTDPEIRRFLENGEYGILCTAGRDGFPCGTPVNYVFSGGRIYFHGSGKGEKAVNLAADPRCCFTVARSYGCVATGSTACNITASYESVIVKGTAAPVADPGEKEAVLRAIIGSLTPGRKDLPM